VSNIRQSLKKAVLLIFFSMAAIGLGCSLLHPSLPEAEIEKKDIPIDNYGMYHESWQGKRELVIWVSESTWLRWTEEQKATFIENGEQQAVEETQQCTEGGVNRIEVWASDTPGDPYIQFFMQCEKSAV
jgi:hypothetical protein